MNDTQIQSASDPTTERNGDVSQTSTLLHGIIPLDASDDPTSHTTSFNTQTETRPPRVDEKDPAILVVDWDGPDDPANPKNWTFRQKWAATAIVSAFTFISPVSSSMVAPASNQVAEQLGIQSSVMVAFITSIFVLAYAFGPLILGPLSEIYGRSRVLQVTNLWYLVWNLACGFAQTESQLLGFRFLAGLGGSAPLAIGGGVIGDCWHAEERGQAVGVYTLAPLLGPVIGPITGAWIAQLSTWRWVFWSTTVVDAIIQLMGLVFLKETYAPLLLERKAKRIRKSMDEEKVPHIEVRTIFDVNEDRSWQAIMKKALVRPFALFIQEPIIQLFGTYSAFLYGMLYLFLTTMPNIFTGVYQESVGISGLHYIALGVGLTGASQLNARMLDKIYAYLKDKNGGVGKPEYRLPAVFPGTVLLPIGLLITGWTVQEHTHWIAPDIGIAIVGASMILNFQCLQTYVVDAFTLYAASAMAAIAFLRSLAGCGFPLFAPAMYNALGFGKGNTVLAAIAIGIGCPAPWIFWHYGERIRNASRHAL